jgi:hypothetical protein
LFCVQFVGLINSSKLKPQQVPCQISFVVEETTEKNYVCHQEAVRNQASITTESPHRWDECNDVKSQVETVEQSEWIDDIESDITIAKCPSRCFIFRPAVINVLE